MEHKHPRYFFRLPYKFPCEHILHLQARTQILQLFPQATTQFCTLKLKDFPGANTFFPANSPGYHTSFPVNRDYCSRLKHNFPRYLSVLLRDFPREYRLFFQPRTQVCPLFLNAVTPIALVSLPNFPDWNTNIPAISPGYYASVTVYIDCFF